MTDKTIVDIQMTLYQPDQPGSDKPGFIYRKGDLYKRYFVQYSDGSGESYISTKPELKEQSK